jgi:NADPH:quinone reductase-like Zn-dependent oxidoreductase
MKEAILHYRLRVGIADSPYPKITTDQVLIKVTVSDSNPKDWENPKLINKPHNSLGMILLVLLKRLVRM